MVNPVGSRLIVEMDQPDPGRITRQIVQGDGRGIGGRAVDERTGGEAVAERTGRRTSRDAERGAGKTENAAPG
jgi:hypothetical protein